MDAAFRELDAADEGVLVHGEFGRGGLHEGAQGGFGRAEAGVGDHFGPQGLTEPRDDVEAGGIEHSGFDAVEFEGDADRAADVLLEFGDVAE